VNQLRLRAAFSRGHSDGLILGVVIDHFGLVALGEDSHCRPLCVIYCLLKFNKLANGH